MMRLFVPAILLVSACSGGETETNNAAGVPIGDGLSVNALAANEAMVLPDADASNEAAPSPAASESESAAAPPARPEAPPPPPPPADTAGSKGRTKAVAEPPPRTEDDPHAGHDMENEGG
jgi:hypothetical protein